MDDREKSDGRVVPVKLSNNAQGGAAEMVEGRRSAKGNTAGETRPGLSAGQGASSELGRVRRVAARDKEARFTALLHHVDVDRLGMAYFALRPKAAPGVDGVTWADYGLDLEDNLSDLHARVHRGAYRARPSRRVYIPKPDGRLRPLGIAALEDKIVQRALVEVLNAIYVTDFLGFSYGFRQGRSPHRALDALAAGIVGKKVNWVLDADFSDYLEPSSHCLCVHGGGVEEGGFGCWDVYSQAFSASVADVDGLQFAALDTLQHGLARDAERDGCFEHRQPAGGSVFDEQGAELVVDADPPRGAGGVLFAGDESVLEPAVKGGGGDAELVGGLADGKQLPVGRLVGRLVGGNVAVAAQPADDDLGEPLAGGGAAALAVEDPGDRRVVVAGGQPSEQRDRVLVGADRWLVAGERDRELGDRAAFPADRDARLVFVAVDVEDDFLDQAAQQLFAVAVGGARRGPHAAEVCAERQQLLALGFGERLGSLLLAQSQLGLGLGQRPERGLPVAFQAAGNEPVLGLDLAVAALSALGLVLGTLDLQAPLAQRGVVVLL